MACSASRRRKPPCQTRPLTWSPIAGGTNNYPLLPAVDHPSAQTPAPVAGKVTPGARCGEPKGSRPRPAKRPARVCGGLHEPFFDKLAPSGRDCVALARPVNDAAPALGNELGLHAIYLQPVAEPAVHARYREPHLGPGQLQQRLQLRQPESVLLDQPFRPPADNGVEMSLHFQQHSRRYAVPVLRSQRGQQMSMTSPVRDVHGTFAACVLMGAPSARVEQLLDHRDWSTVPSGLVERSVPGGSSWSGRVDPLSMFGQQLEHTLPIA